MTKIYGDADLWDCFRQKRNLLWGFFAATAVCFGALLGLCIYFIGLPYNDPNGLWVKIVSCVIAAIYVIFCFPYLGICVKRSRAYCRMMRFISVGLKEYSVVPFDGIDDWTTRDGVDVNVACFRVHNRKREEDMIRHIYIDGEKDFPAFEEGKFAKIVSQGNLLIEYELLDLKDEFFEEENRAEETAPDREGAAQAAEKGE